jgi:1,4-dihydroxy-2-naphthoyl-CoA hydrolase
VSTDTPLVPGDPATTEWIQTAMPFTGLCEVVIDSFDTEKVVGRVAWKDKFCTVNGNLHGGYLMSLADAVGAWLSVQHLPEGAGTSTISSSTNFLRPAPQAVYSIVSTLVMAGRRTITVTTDVINPAGKVVSRTTQTQAVLTS